MSLCINLNIIFQNNEIMGRPTKVKKPSKQNKPGKNLTKIESASSFQNLWQSRWLLRLRKEEPIENPLIQDPETVQPAAIRKSTIN